MGCMGTARWGKPEGKGRQHSHTDRPLFLLLIDILGAISKLLRIFFKEERMLLRRYLMSLTSLLII